MKWEECFFFCFIASFVFVSFSYAENRSLSFEQRVSCQKAIEEVYWRHTLWPAENPQAKPPLQQIWSEKDFRSKVAHYLQKSSALDSYRHRAITGKDLQAEMDRIAKESKDPQLLRELWGALDNDPFVIAECFARQVLAERLTEHLTVFDRLSGHEHDLPNLFLAASYNYRLPEIGNDSFQPSAVQATSKAPTARAEHTAVWTGTEMIIWGGRTSSRSLDTGSRYNPATNSWAATPRNGAPSPRYSHTAIWTGTEMIIWGGRNTARPFNSGSRYNPSTNLWTATSGSHSPPARAYHTVVWTGTEMIVWGGSSPASNFDTGGRYNPSTNSWATLPRNGAPSGRFLHTAVWTGQQMIIWGGFHGFFDQISLNNGKRYNPSTNSWTAISTTGAPSGRGEQTAVWTGKQMVIWGGCTQTIEQFICTGQNTGGRYDPSTNSWVATTTTHAPSARSRHTAVWTGKRMIIWGGGVCDFFCGSLNSGGRYNPSGNSWTATSTTGAPSARFGHTAVWTGKQMIIWGGFFTNTGGRYSPSNRWSATE
jgi:N-acetylneuraminic acid mutarotase